MKGFVIFDSLNDVVFRQLDGELVKHLLDLAVKNELVAQPTVEVLDAAVTNDVLVQLFSPLVTSQRVMKEKMNNMYSSIYCKDQTLCVFAEFLDHTLLGINSERDDTEALARKRLKVFRNLVQRLYGPALHALRSHCVSGNKRAQLLGKLMDAYDRLSQEDQVFLVEALDHTIVNSEIRKTCSQLLQEILESFRRYSRSGEMASHAYLFVNNKLVATFLSRNSTLLSHADLLVLSLTLRVLHETGASDEQQGSGCSQLSHLLMFFATSLRSAMPYIVHWLKVDDDITLVITSELNRALLADGLFGLMKQLHSIQQSPEEGRCRLTMDMLESAIKRTLDASRRLDLKSDQEASINVVAKKWMHLKMSGFADYLSGTENADVAARARCEEALLLLNKTLQLTFEELVLKPEIHHEKEPRLRLMENLEYITALVRKRLEGFRSFLLMKADHGLNVGSFLQGYPGLLHFIYVNRSANQMVSPTLSPEGASGLQEKVWKAWGFAQKYAHEGSFTTMWAENELQYSYLLWFSNHSGKTVKPKCAVDPMSLSQMYYPGVLAGNFYSQLMRYCFPDVSLDQLVCLEVLCIHSESAAASTIIDQVQQLTSTLWDVWDSTSVDLD